MSDKILYRWTNCRHVMTGIECPECLKEQLASTDEYAKEQYAGYESQLKAAKQALEDEQLKRSDWDVAFEGLETKLKAAKEEVRAINKGAEINAKVSKLAVEESAELRRKLERARGALATGIERMRILNGPDSNCVYTGDLEHCANHYWIRDAKKALEEIGQ